MRSNLDSPATLQELHRNLITRLEYFETKNGKTEARSDWTGFFSARVGRRKNKFGALRLSNKNARKFKFDNSSIRDCYKLAWFKCFITSH
jgi:hypothetical protein